MDATRWNERFEVGQPIILTLANRKRLLTRTTTQAEHWGGLDHVAVAAIPRGYVLLSWCWPIKANAPARIRDLAR